MCSVFYIMVRIIPVVKYQQIIGELFIHQLHEDHLI
jgi:hypothetical protein